MPSSESVEGAWRAYGLTPLPALAPPYLPLGGPHPALHVVPYDEQRVEVDQLDARWSVWRVALGGVPTGEPRAGDVVVLRSGSKSARGKSGRWSAPSRVVDVRPKNGGPAWMWVLTDNSLEVLSAADVRRQDPELIRDLDVSGPLDDELKRRVRSLWGLDVWCPVCGSEGLPVLVGLPAPGMFDGRDSAGELLPWPAGSISSYGCVIMDEPIPAYSCPRCKTSWGDQ